MVHKKCIFVVIGTRPEAIKLAPVIRKLRDADDAFRTVVISTEQHKQMLQQVMDLFSIAPDRRLDVMRPNQSLSGVMSAVLERLDQLLVEEAPDLILVQGDTTTATAASIAAFHRRVPVGHVEAGLRTYDLDAPFPEEFNRRLIGVAARFHFAPTERARQALLTEHVPADTVHMVGNTVVDALLSVVETLPKNSTLDDLVPGLPPDAPLVLVTGHRRENFGEGFEAICLALRDIADRVPDAHIVYPVHLNPNVRAPVNRLLAGHARIHLLEPVNYRDMVRLMQASTLVLTDSGGIQEEAPTFGKPVLVMRNVTERPEAVEAGVARLVGTDQSAIVDTAVELLDNPAAYHAMSQACSPFGDGHSAERIVEIIRQALVLKQ